MVQAFKIGVDSWKFSMLLLYILWNHRPIFMISASKEQLQQQLEYTLLKPECHSWWISKMQSGREDTLEEWYAIKFWFKIGKMPQKRMECFRLLLEHLAWIEHEFLSGIRDSRKAGSLLGMLRGVGGVRMSVHQSCLARELGLGLLCWSFKEVQEEILSEEASTLQIGSEAFPPGQCSSPQLQVWRTRHVGHSRRSEDELISDVLFWTSSHGRTSIGLPVRSYLQQLCTDTRCSLEDLPGAMNDRDQ